MNFIRTLFNKATFVWFEILRWCCSLQNCNISQLSYMFPLDFQMYFQLHFQLKFKCSKCMVLQVYLSFIKQLMSAVLPVSHVIKHTFYIILMTFPLMVLRINHRQDGFLGFKPCIFYFYFELYSNFLLY